MLPHDISLKCFFGYASTQPRWVHLLVFVSQLRLLRCARTDRLARSMKSCSDVGFLYVGEPEIKALVDDAAGCGCDQKALYPPTVHAQPVGASAVRDQRRAAALC